MSIVASALVAIAIFALGLLLSGGLHGIVVRRARQRQDLIDMLEKLPGTASDEEIELLRVEQRRDLEQILVDRDVVARVEPGDYFRTRRFLASLNADSLRFTVLNVGALVVVLIAVGVIAAYVAGGFLGPPQVRAAYLNGWPRWPFYAAVAVVLAPAVGFTVLMTATEWFDFIGRRNRAARARGRR